MLPRQAVREGFAAERGLFSTAGGLAFPRPEAAALGGEGLALLRLLGLLLGKALFEGILLGAPLAPFFVARLQARAGRAPPGRSMPSFLQTEQCSCLARHAAGAGALARLQAQQVRECATWHRLGAERSKA